MDLLCALAQVLVPRGCAVLISIVHPNLLLQIEGSGPPISVCTGAEWHRFPSAFFLPGQRYRLQVGWCCMMGQPHSGRL